MHALEAASWWNAGMRDLAAHLIELASLGDECTALDVGCGSGQTVGWLKRTHESWKALGLDIAIEGLSVARDCGLDVIRASAFDIPLASASVDFISVFDVLHHLPLAGGDVAALREMRRVVRPGGYLLVRTNARSFPYKDDDTVSQYHTYETKDLRRKLQSAGFRVVRMSRANGLLGLAEIPRELKARRQSDRGILAPDPVAPGPADTIKRAWLRLEGALIVSGLRLPLGRSIVALCRAEATSCMSGQGTAG
ncbi:MAG: class I SAM-dependent methyltransferase [Gemmatimonadaceae bacterium]